MWSGVLCAGRVRWDDPFGGTCQDTFCISDDGQQLTQVTEMVMNTGRLCNYRWALNACFMTVVWCDATLLISCSGKFSALCSAVLQACANLEKDQLQLPFMTLSLLPYTFVVNTQFLCRTVYRRAPSWQSREACASAMVSHTIAGCSILDRHLCTLLLQHPGRDIRHSVYKTCPAVSACWHTMVVRYRKSTLHTCDGQQC